MHKKEDTKKADQLATGEGSNLATVNRRLSPKDAQLLANASPEDRRAITQLLALSDDEYKVVFAILQLMTEGQNGQPLLTDQQRTEALALALPLLESLRFDGGLQIELEKFLAEIKGGPS